MAPLRRFTAVPLLVALLAGSLLVACGDEDGDSGSTDSDGEGAIAVTDVWSRPTVLLDEPETPESGEHEHEADATEGGAGTNGVVYMTVENEGSEGDMLVSASSEVAGAVELHQVNMVGDVAQMRQVEGGVELPAGETVTFEPGGLHVMLVGLTRSLEAGASFELTLTFETAEPMTVDVEVREQ